MKKIQIGVAYSSRNRPDLLKICLEHLYQNLSTDKYEYVIVVVNDLSNEEFRADYKALKKSYPDVIWHTAKERLGIAKAKNRGIKTLKENKVDHFFLWDDDCYPIKKGWEQIYIDAALNNDIHHLMHQIPVNGWLNPRRIENRIVEFDNSSGVMLYFSKHAINTIGGYRKAFNIYGYEHSSTSMRCHVGGLTGKFGAYNSVENSRDYIYSLDLEMNCNGIPPSDYEFSTAQFRSSVEGENVQLYIQQNSPIYSQIQPIYEEI